MQPHTHVVQVDVYSLMESPESEFPIEQEIPAKPLEISRRTSYSKKPIPGEPAVPLPIEHKEKYGVPDSQQLSMSPPKPMNSNVPEQHLP